MLHCFHDPTWSKPALTLLALWGIGDLMVIFMASLLDVPREQYEAAELDGAGGLAAVPVRDPAEHLADHHLRGGHRRDPDHAVLHAAAGRREGRLGIIQGSGHAVRARLPRQVDTHPAPARLQPRLPALRLRLRLCGRPRAVRPVDGVHRAADAAPGRPHPGR